MKKIATTLLSSRKFLGLLLTLSVLLLTRKFGLDEETATEVSRQVLAAGAVYMGAQGLADFGKEKAKINVDFAKS